MKASGGTVISRFEYERPDHPLISTSGKARSQAKAIPVATKKAVQPEADSTVAVIAMAARSPATANKADPMTDLTDQDTGTAGSDGTEAQPGAGAQVPRNAATEAPESVAPRPAHGSERRPVSHGGPISVPRAPAKAEVFVEGDHVVYPTHGVGKVERIATEEIAGHRLELIHITFEENRMTLRVPVAKARSAGLRKLATRDMFDEALKVLRGKARIKRTMWSRRAQEYEAKINSGDPLAIAEVVRDLHRNAGQPDQSFSERQIYEAAMDRLAAELAALDKTDKTTAANKLAEFLKTV
jgi:CarD family transcriptional regulator